MKKSLALYIDKWYIVGTVCVDDVPRPISLPNHEDRIWLYFFEDIPNDTISYGKGYETKFRNKENHYYGDVFSQITSSSAKYTVFKSSQPIKGIFDSARIFDDLRKNMEEDGEIETFVSFSQDISLAAQELFLRELEAKHFNVKERVARIGHLALEHAAQKNGYEEEGYYLVLNACNENLHYSLYKKTGDIFVRNAEESLSGMGMDVRRRALIEYVVDHINSSELFLKTQEEREAEYLRMEHFVVEWLNKLSATKTRIPVSLTGITFSHDSFKQYSVSVPKAKIDERTEKIVGDIVRVVVELAKDKQVNHDQIRGIVFLGNTFTNNQFRKELAKYYNLSDARMMCFKDIDLATLVSVYNYIDLGQFSAISGIVKGNAEEELRRIQQAEEEKKAREKAQAEANENERIIRENEEKERRFREAMEKGYESEREHDYKDMAEFFKIALGLHSEDNEAKQKHEEAIFKMKEQETVQRMYKERIQQARAAFDEQDYETARQKAEEALGYMSDSKEAQHIKKESLQYLRNIKDFERYLDRADIFIAQKAYAEANEELAKARLLNLNEKEVSERETKIAKELAAVKTRIQSLIAALDDAISNKRYEEAISTCNELVRVDSGNSSRWTARVADIRHKQEMQKEAEQRLIDLQNKIDQAQWDEDWKSLVALCKEALNIKEDVSIREKLQRGEKRLAKQKEIETFNSAIAEIKDLILSADFAEAKTKLNQIEQTSSNADQKEKIRNLRKQMFEKEDLSERAKRPEVMSDNFFDNKDVDKTKKISQKGRSSISQAGPPIIDDFFEEKPTSYKKEKSQNGSKKNLTNDDFDFGRRT